MLYMHDYNIILHDDVYNYFVITIIVILVLYFFFPFECGTVDCCTVVAALILCSKLKSEISYKKSCNSN